MYKRILVPVENSAADRTILGHVTRLARLTGASLVLLHVADGWAARSFAELNLRESEEMRDDRDYLMQVAAQLRAEGFDVETRLALGEPAVEICKAAEEVGADLITMATHGHRGLADLILGQTVDRVRHAVAVPVLLLRARPADPHPHASRRAAAKTEAGG